MLQMISKCRVSNKLEAKAVASKRWQGGPVGRAGHDVTDRHQLPEDGGGQREGAGPACCGKALRGQSASGIVTVGSVRQVVPLKEP